MMRLLVLAPLCAWIAIASGQSSSDQLESYRKILETTRNNSLAHYKIGEIFLSEHNYQSAANEFREALSGDLQPRWVEVWAHINLGKIFDLTNQHERAVNEYKQAQRTKDYSFRAISGAGRSIGDAAGPVLLQKTDAEYTEEARVAGLEGTVLVSGVVGEDGVMRNAAVTQHLGLGLDEKAAESVQHWLFAPGMYQERPKGMVATFAVDFFLPLKQSRWHLIRAAFGTPEGASRPTVVSAEYPPGAGVQADDAIEEGKLLGVVGRQATATVVLQVNEQGMPVNIQVRAASDKMWGPEAVALVSRWRFAPGIKDGKPISIPCALDLVWGPKNLTAPMVAQLRDVANSASDGFGVVTGAIPVQDVAGKTIVLSGFVKTEGITRGWAGFWGRVDGAVMPGQFTVDNGAGERGWQRMELTIPVARDAKDVSFGALHTGDGTAWFDGLKIEINGEPYNSDFGVDLDFESTTLGGYLTGGSGYEMELDKQTFHTGKQSLRIRQLPDVLQ